MIFVVEEPVFDGLFSLNPETPFLTGFSFDEQRYNKL